MRVACVYLVCEVRACSVTDFLEAPDTFYTVHGRCRLIALGGVSTHILLRGCLTIAPVAAVGEDRTVMCLGVLSSAGSAPELSSRAITPRVTPDRTREATAGATARQEHGDPHRA